MPILRQPEQRWPRRDLGKEVETREGARLLLGASLSVGPQGQAQAVNGQYISESHRATTKLAGKTAMLLGIQRSGGWVRAMLLKI